MAKEYEGGGGVINYCKTANIVIDHLFFQNDCSIMMCTGNKNFTPAFCSRKNANHRGTSGNHRLCVLKLVRYDTTRIKVQLSMRHAIVCSRSIALFLAKRAKFLVENIIRLR